MTPNELMLGCLSDIKSRLAGYSGVERQAYLIGLRDSFQLWSYDKGMRAYLQLPEFVEFSDFVKEQVKKTVKTG